MSLPGISIPVSRKSGRHNSRDTASAPSVDDEILSVRIYSWDPLRAVETHQAFVCRIHLPAAGLLQPGHVLQPCLPAEGFALVRRDFSGLVTARPAGCFPAEGGFVAVLFHPYDDGIVECPQPEEAYPAPVGGLPQGRLARCANRGDQERKQ